MGEGSSSRVGSTQAMPPSTSRFGNAPRSRTYRGGLGVISSSKNTTKLSLNKQDNNSESSKGRLGLRSLMPGKSSRSKTGFPSVSKKIPDSVVISNFFPSDDEKSTKKSPVRKLKVMCGAHSDADTESTRPISTIASSQSEPSTVKTSIQVCIRIRPMLIIPVRALTPKSNMGKKLSNRSRSSVSDNVGVSASTRSMLNMPAFVISPNEQTISQNPDTNPDPTRSSSYSFDNIFGSKSQTKDLYGRSIRSIVKSAMEGYHGSVFAYGQTSTGKTHTMQGTPSEPGIVPLAIQDVFNYIKNNGSVDDREYLLRVSYMEIYNEQICDLLVPSQGVDSARFGGFVASAPTAIRIFESKSQGVIVRGLKEEVVTSTKQVMAFIEAGDSQRRTGSTEMNAHSSRSHSICRLIIESKARKSRGRRFRDAGDSGSVISESTTTTEINNSPVRISTLNLVDLAGSECAKLTNATGVRKKEGQYINKSLMTLGLCIWKLSEASIRAESSIEGKSPKKSPKSSLDNVDHIPYRDSKLTRLLQPSLSGNAQICIICTVTPSMRHLEESLNTLKFAARAKKITQKAEITECVDDKTLINTYRSEISELKRQLKEMSEDRETLHVPKAIQPSQNVIIEENDCDDVNDEETEALRLAIGNLEKLILKNAVKKDDSSSSSISDEESVLLVSRRTQESLLIDTEISDSNVLLQGSATSENDSRALNVKKNDGRNSPSSELGRANPKKKDDVSVTSDSSNLVNELHRIQGLLGNVLSKKKKTLPKVVIVNTMSPSTSNIESEVEQLKAQLRDQEVATSLSQADSTFLQSQLVEKDNLLGEVSMVLDNVTKRQVQLEQENFLLRQENTRLKSELTRTKGEGKLRQREIENLKKKQNADDEMFSSLI